MPTSPLRELLQEHGLAIVFVNVLGEQLGLPIPAVPTLVLAGAVAADGAYSTWAVLAVALAGCVAGDAAWYVIGRRYGARVLRLLCSISLTPDSCVRQTGEHFERWGPWTLVLAKFLPGIGTIVPPVAGVMRLPWPRFLLLTTLGSVAWAGLAVGAGALMRAQVSALLEALQQFGMTAVALAAALLAAYIAFKYWERQRFYKTLRMARITVDELRSLMQRDEKPFVVDLRAAAERRRDGRSIPGALAIDLAEVERLIERFPPDRDIIFFCSCPNEASAASAAKTLMDHGFRRVRPLLGGLDAWAAAGYDMEP